jgi:hypothetical protein
MVCPSALWLGPLFTGNPRPGDKRLISLPALIRSYNVWAKAMKHFTIQWWSGEIEDQMPAFRAYDEYLAGVRMELLPELRRLLDEVSLHDSRLRRLHISPEKKELLIELDGCGPDEGQQSYHALKIRLMYSSVESFESLADPEAGLAGPHGYGDLGYDEIEILRPGLFQHRMLFSTGIEFAVTFTGFRLVHERAEEAQPGGTDNSGASPLRV